jgi:hypothetical protein
MTLGDQDVRIPAGFWKDLYVHYSGTNQAAQDTAASNLGTMRLTVNGQQKQFCNVDRMQTYNAYKGGAIAAANATGGAFNFQVQLPQAVPGDDVNGLFVERDGEVILELRSFYTAARVLSGTVYVYGTPALGVQSYYNAINQIDFANISGTSEEPQFQNLENLYEALIENDTNLTRLTIKADGKTVVDAVREGIYNLTNWINQLETYSATQAYLDIMFAPTKQLAETLNDSIALQYVASGAGTINTVVFQIDYAPDKKHASQALYAQAVSSMLGQKSNAGKTRPVEVLGSP